MGARATATGGTARGALGAFARLALLMVAIAIVPAPADGGVHAVFPSVALPSGAASAVTVVGVDFFQTPKTSCRFGGVVTRGDVVDASTFVCYPPPRTLTASALSGATLNLNGFVDVEVSMNAADFTKSGATFQYVEPASVASVAPRSGDAGGGSLVVATAAANTSGFTAQSRCAFLFAATRGGETADAVETWTLDAGAAFVSSAILACEAPGARSTGSARIAATTAEAAAYGDEAGRHGSAAWSARAAAPEAIAATATLASATGPAAVTSFAAPEAGGASVTFFLGAGVGTDAVADATAVTCRFGTVTTRAYAVDPGSARDAETVSPRRLATATCATPAGRPSRGVPSPAWVAASISDRAPSAVPAMTREPSVIATPSTIASDGGTTADARGAPGVAAAVTPRRVSTAGTPAAVAVTGSGFSRRDGRFASRCVIDGVASAPAVVVSSALMLCELPASPGGAGVATVAASASPRALAAARADGATVTYAAEALAVRMDVTLGSASGGTAAIISSSAALPDGDAASVVAARFGALGPVATRFVSRFAAETVTPARRPGAVGARLDGGAGASAASTAYTLLFRYAEPGAVAAAIPTLVPVTGNVRVELFGWGRSVLGVGPVACVFSGAAASRDDACVAPPGGVGFVAVGVAGALAADAGSASVAYAPRPRVAGVAPRINYARGGAVTTLSGADFVSERGVVATCEFGSSDGAGVAASVAFVSSAVARCETPALAPGAMATLELAAGAAESSLRSASGMTVTVLATPRVLAATPSGGPLRGGDVIAVAGENFVGVEPAACRIGSVGPLDARDADAAGALGGSTLECVAPAREIGAARVAVGARTGAGYTDDDVWYEYVSALPVEFVVPSTAESGGAGARALAVFGATLRKDDRAPCVVGARSAPGEVKRHGEMTCGGEALGAALDGGSALDAGFAFTGSRSSDAFARASSRFAGLGRGAFDAFRGEGFFAVGAGGLRSAADGELAVVFHFRKPAEAVSVRPVAGFAGGGTVVRVSGRDMAPETGCAFGTTVVYPHVSLESSALAQCESPAFPENLAPGVAVAVAASDALAPPGADAPAFLFASRAEPVVLDVAPESVAGSGGTVIRVFLFGEHATVVDGGRVVPACAFGAVAPVAARLAVGDAAAACVSPALARGGVSLRAGDAFGEYGRVGRDVAVRTLPAATAGDEALGDVRGRLDRPTATAAYPDVASPSGGARVVFAGASLDRARGGGGLLFGGARVRFAAVVSSALAFVEAPPRSSASSAVAVSAFAVAETRAGASFATEDDEPPSVAVAFAFAASFEAVSVSPKHVVSTFGGLVTVRGAFDDARGAGAGSPQCRFGSAGPVDARVVDATSVECVAPARAEGSVIVAAAARGDTMFSFRILAPPLVLEYVDEAEAASRDAREARGPEWLRVERGAARAAAPAAAPRGGGARAHVFGENLGPFVAFGDVVVPVGAFVSSRLVLVETPPEPLVATDGRATRAPFATIDFETRVALRDFDGARGEPSAAESAESVAFAYFDAPRGVTFAPRAVTEDGGVGLAVALAVSATTAAIPASACRVGTIGPLVGVPRPPEAAERFAATTCVSPASAPGARRVAADSGLGSAERSRDVSSWISSLELLSVIPAAKVTAVVPSAAVRASAQRLDVVGAWLDAAACDGDAETSPAAEPSFATRVACAPSSALDTGARARVFVAVRVAAVSPTPGSAASAGMSTRLVFARLAAPRVARVGAGTAGVEGGGVATLSGDAFFGVSEGDVSASPPLACVFSSFTGGAATASAPARVVSGALATCETPPLAALLGVGGGEAAVSLAPAGELAAEPTAAARQAAAPTPWVLAHAPTRGGASGGVSVTVTVGGAVEGVRGRASPPNDAPRVTQTPERSSDAPSSATLASCAFGAVAPVAARPAGARSRDVTCVSPAARHGTLAPLRVFAGAAVAAPPSPRARGRGARDAALFHVDHEGRATATMRAAARDGAAASRDAGARRLVVGWGLRPRDACAHGGADAQTQTVTYRGGAMRVDPSGVLSPSSLRAFERAPPGSGLVECAAPRGPAGFAVLAAASPRAAFAGVAFQFSRADADPAVARVAPAAALAGLGDVLHAAGANLHAARALEWRGGDGSGSGSGSPRVSAAALESVSSAVAVFETPPLAARAEARLVGAADAPGPENAHARAVDPGGDVFAVPVAANRVVAAVRPAAGSSSGGTRVSLSSAPRDAPFERLFEEAKEAKPETETDETSACWFGAVGPVRGAAFDKDSGSVACASPAGAPARRGVSTRLAFAPPGAGAGAGRAGGEAASASSLFFRVGDPPVPAALLRAVVVAPAGGDALAWVPEWDPRRPEDGSFAMRHDGETMPSTRVVRAFAPPPALRRGGGGASGFLVSATLAPGAGGFGALAASRLGERRTPSTAFAHVPRAAAPELRALVGPSETLSTGGALVFLSGSDLRGGADLGVAASIEPVALAGGGGAAGGAARSVSSALAVFETPRVAAGAATLRLALGLGCAACPGSSSALPLATRPLGATRGPTAEPATWFASPAAGGAGTTARVRGAFFVSETGDAGAGCRFGTVSTAASSVTATSVSCVAPALGIGVGVVETTFNGREYTADGEARFRVVDPPSALVGALPSATPASVPDGVVFGVDVVGAGLQKFDRLRHLPRADRLELFGFDDADDAAYDADADVWADAASGSPALWRSFGGVVAARVAEASPSASPRLAGVADGFGLGFGFVAVAVDAAAAMVNGAAALEHLVVSVFAPPRTDALDPPLGPVLGATVVFASGRDLARGDAAAGDDDASSTFAALIGAADGSGAALVVPLARVVSSALAAFETPDLSAAASLADTVVVRVVAGARRASASTAANPSFVPTSAEATAPRLVGGGTASSAGGSTVTLSFVGLAVGAARIPAWCRFGAVGPVAGREREGESGDAAGTTRVACVAPAAREGARATVWASENRRDWFAAANAAARAGDGVVASVVTFASAARPAFAFPPAASATGGGVFGGDRGVAVALDVPGPAPETVAVSALGCAYGGVAVAAARGAAAPLRSGPGSSRALGLFAECFPASDPFMEGFFPLHFFLDGRSDRAPDAAAPRPGVALVSDPAYPTQIPFEYVAPPRARAIAPTVAHVGGGAAVFVAGADLRRDERDATACALASAISGTAPFAAAVPVAVAVSSALVACEIPPALPAGAHAARVALAGADAFGVGASAAASAAALVATPAPTIRDASPTAVTAHGGARVALTGTRLRAVSADDTLAATFGTFAPVALTPGSASEATFVAPARRPSANVAVGARRSLADAHARTPSGFAFETVAPFTPLRDGAVPSVAPASSEGGAETRAGGALVFVALAPPRFFATAGGGGAAAVAPAFLAAPRRGFAAVSALAPVAGHDGGAEKPPESGSTRTPRVLFANARGGAVQLEFRAAARVSSAHPRLAVAVRARAGGGSVLDVSGSDFARPETRVRFGPAASGAAATAAHVVSSAYLRVEVFGDHAPGARVPMDLASAPGFAPRGGAEAGDAFTESGVAVEARAAPAVFRARPAFGSEEGGVAVALTGAGFRDVGASLRCRFGSVAVMASAFVDANRVECVSPARAPEAAADVVRAAPVAVTVNGRDFSAAAVGSGAPGVSLYDRIHEHSGAGATPAHAHSGREASFAYGAKLEVFSLDPTRGPASGGTEVIARGAHFLGPFGGAPAGAAAALVPGTTGAETLEPTESDRGYFFFGCKFDQTVVPASAGSVTPSSAACRSPPHAAGFVAVEVRAGVAGNFTVFGATFEFQAPPRAATLFPPVGAAGGGTLVSVAGADFVDAGSAHEGGDASPTRDAAGARFAPSPLRCRFGGGAESAATRVSSAVLRCETPSFAASAVDRALPVDVSLNGGRDFGDATSQTAFEPLASPLVLSLEPRAGTAGGGTVVRVFGRGFTADAPVWCRFGTTGPIPAEYASEGAVRCKSPAKATASRIPVEVSRGNTLDLTTDAVLFSV